MKKLLKLTALKWLFKVLGVEGRVNTGVNVKGFVRNKESYWEHDKIRDKDWDLKGLAYQIYLEKFSLDESNYEFKF
jgi:hypothetical protein